MENQGYEEETSTRPPSSPHNWRSLTRPSSPTIVKNSRSSPIAQRIHAIGVHSLRTDPEAHVYEDIVISGLEDSTIVTTDDTSRLPTHPVVINNNKNNSSGSNNNNNNNHKLCNELDTVEWSQNVQRRNTNSNNNMRFCSTTSNEAESLSLSSDELENSSNFHRNLTLPLRRPGGAIDNGENSSRFSVRVTNRERARCLADDNNSALYESSIGSVRRTGDGVESSRGTSLAIDKPGRRRRKKDCKHCKSKANGNISVADQLERVTKHDSTTFPLDRLSDRVQASANNEIIGRDEKLRRLCIEPIFALPNGNLPSFHSQGPGECSPVALSEGRTNTIFSISNNTNGASPTNIPILLNYDKNDTDVRLVHVELPDERAFVTPKKNRLEMKVNSIYSQDLWHSKDVPIFVSDVKDQSPFQVSVKFCQLKIFDLPFEQLITSQ